jgi:hypothetical protein
MGRPKKIRGACTVEGCGSGERCGGLCLRHYTAARRKRLSPKVDADPSRWLPEDVAWVAGLLEARGVFAASLRSDGNRFSVKVQLLDAAVAERACRSLGIGSAGGPYKNFRSRHQQVWVWTVGRKQHIQALCGAIGPWMSSVRQRQIDKLLDAIER